MTVDVERSVVIARPPSEAFAFVSDLSNEPRFHTDVAAVKRVTEGPIGVGTVFEFKPKTGQVERVTARVVRLTPGREIAFDAEFGKMQVHRVYRVAPEGAGSRVSHRVQIEMKGPMKLMSFMMRRMVAKRWDEFLANLKRVLEEEKTWQ